MDITDVYAFKRDFCFAKVLALKKTDADYENAHDTDADPTDYWKQVWAAADTLNVLEQDYIEGLPKVAQMTLENVLYLVLGYVNLWTDIPDVSAYTDDKRIIDLDLTGVNKEESQSSILSIFESTAKKVEYWFTIAPPGDQEGTGFDVVCEATRTISSLNAYLQGMKILCPQGQIQHVTGFHCTSINDGQFFFELTLAK